MQKVSQEEAERGLISEVLDCASDIDHALIQNEMLFLEDIRNKGKVPSLKDVNAIRSHVQEMQGHVLLLDQSLEKLESMIVTIVGKTSEGE